MPELGPPPRVYVKGLGELRRALKSINNLLTREVNAELKDAVRPVASRAASKAPKKSGRLAASTKSGGTARGAYIGAGSQAVPYAGIREFGGSIWFPSRGGGLTFEAQPFLRPAAEEAGDDIADDVSARLDRLLRRHGF